jgi:hypothetical protein
MKDLLPSFKRVLQTSAITVLLATALAGCGGGDSGNAATASTSALSAAPPAASVNPQVIPHNATYRGKTYSQWEVSFWQWALALPLGPLPHPFADCTRPISAGQSGNVWYWSAPDMPNETCDQSATVIPAGTSIFLSTLDDEASSLEDDPPFNQTTAEGQLAVARQFADYIQDLFVIIDGVPLKDLTAYRTTTDQFKFTAPAPWIFDPDGPGGNGSAVGDGYFFMLKPLPPGSHTIHYGGRFHIPASAGGPVDIVKDTTLMITVGP